jgi:apolipoprotein N-acyltransferase
VNIRQFFNASPKHYVIAAFSGLLLTFSFPPIGHPLVGWVVLVPLLFLATTNKPHVCFTLGWFAGICHGLSLLYWITYVVNHYGNLPLPVSLLVCFLLVAYLALFPGLFCAGSSWLRQRSLPWLPLAPFLWVTLELGKSHLLTGFPWENLGYSQYRWLPAIQMADLAGVYGISFVLVLSSALLFWMIFASKYQRKRVTPVISTLLLVGLLAVVYGYGRWRLATLESHRDQSFKVAMVQGNVSQDTKWDPAFQQATLEKYLRLTNEIAKQQPDLVVWPETATPFYFLADRQNTKTLIQEVQKLKIPLLFGSPAYRRKGTELRLYNRAYLLDGDGMLTGYYDKIHLVPFGEYVPWKKILCLFVTKPSFLHSVATWPMVVPICWSTLPTMPGLVVAAPLTNIFPWRYCVQLRIEYPLPVAPTPESVLLSMLKAVSFKRPVCTRTRPCWLLSSWETARPFTPVMATGSPGPVWLSRCSYSAIH